METQQCRTCGEVKGLNLLNLFQKSGKKSNGEQYYRPDCKECRKSIIKEQVTIIDKSIRKELMQEQERNYLVNVVCLFVVIG